MIIQKPLITSTCCLIECYLKSCTGSFKLTICYYLDLKCWFNLLIPKGPTAVSSHCQSFWGLQRISNYYLRLKVVWSMVKSFQDRMVAFLASICMPYNKASQEVARQWNAAHDWLPDLQLISNIIISLATITNMPLKFKQKYSTNHTCSK